MYRYKVKKFYSHVGDFWTVEDSNGEAVGTFDSWLRAYTVADAHAESLRDTRDRLRATRVTFQ